MERIKKKMSFYKLNDKKMTAVKGGENCGCACHYVNCGGSSTTDNYNANFELGYWSTGPGCAEQ